MEAERCKVCNNFDRRQLTAWINMCQHRLAFDCHPAKLLRSSSECHYCRRIFDGIREFRDEIGDFVNSVSRLYARGPADDRPRTLTLELYFQDSRPKLELEFFAHNEDGLSVAKGAICHAKQIFQPTHPILTEGNLAVHLQEIKGLRENYACLSHRWGGSDAGMTRRDTYAQMLSGITWNTIPRTFQDAIKFVHALGLSYLWIDSYCIIQDSAVDWEAESKQMASIFENSYLTIAATAAANNEAGCFWNEGHHNGRSLNDGDDVPSEFRRLSVQKKMQHWERIWTSNREVHFPLLTRAWVFQERLLAPRVLHFSHQELVWECAECGDCQCGGFDNRSNAKTVSWNMNNSWHAAVELYTSLKLSRETDRLAAFHGFADFYARIVPADVGRDCIAGLWKNSLHLDLLWRVDILANSNTDARCLCRCWDTEIRIVNESKSGKTDSELSKADTLESVILEKNSVRWAEESLWRSCQYSYSAACSTTCLQRRRLCRHGNESAAIRLETNIEGLSCVDWHQERTSIPLLLLHEKKQPVAHQRERSICPSWSWASARQSVKYWNDVVPDLRSDGERNTCRFFGNSSPRAVNGISDVKKLVTLKTEGYLVPVILQYQDIPIPESLDSQPISGKATSRVVLSHNILRYGLRIQDQDLDFHPDWILSLDGPKFIPNRTQLFLFHVTSNVYLVLKEEWFFQVPCHDRVPKRHLIHDDLRHKIDLQTKRVEEKASTANRNNSKAREADRHAQETSKTTQEPFSRSSKQEARQSNTNKRGDEAHSIENIPFHPAFRQGPLIADVFLIKARQALPETRSAKNATTKGIKKSHFHHDPLIAGLIPVKAQQAPEKSMSC
ncbi:hypothetical protein PMIN05_012166 [Paraphaeosphaeria minitans]